VHWLLSLQIIEALRGVLTHPLIGSQFVVVQLLLLEQDLGTKEHVPVKGLQDALVHLSGALQTTGTWEQTPALQESTVQLFPSLQFIGLNKHPKVLSQPVVGLQRSVVVHWVGTAVQTPALQDCLMQALEVRLHLGVWTQDPVDWEQE
jgi:hypothetical protein